MGKRLGGVFLAGVSSCVCDYGHMTAPSELFLHLSHGVLFVPRASELNACAGAHGSRMRKRGQKTRDDMACPALPWMPICSGFPMLLHA